MPRRPLPTRTVRLLEERRLELLADLRAIAPELVQKLEETLEALKEHNGERGEYEGLDRIGVIRTYLAKLGRPADLRRSEMQSPLPSAALMPGRSGMAGSGKWNRAAS